MNVWRERSVVSDNGKTVAVVGNHGLLGQWLVRRLLAKGYTVHASLGSSPGEVAEMMAMPGAEQRLQLMTRDLLDYTTLTVVFEGCSGVFLTSPPGESLNGLPDYPAELVNGEVSGTLNVVEACASASSVKRLVFTSSASAIVFDSPEKLIDERCWSNVDFCRKSKAWSALAKTVAEKAAWALARDRGVDLVVMNPAIVVGPYVNFSKGYQSPINAHVSNVVEGIGSGVMAVARVDDVADAHIQALENLDASGRFLCFERLLTENEVLELMKKLYPTQSHSRLREQYTPLVMSNEKLQRLRMKDMLRQNILVQ